MSYSNKEMKTLILDLADKAEPLEASALRDLAQNYHDAREPEPEPYELKFRHLFWIVAAIYAIWTPVYFFMPRDADPPPEGRVVEQIMGFTKSPDGRYTTRTYMFAPGVTYSGGSRQFTFTEDPTPLVVYEGRTPLPKANYEFQGLESKNIWRFVNIKTSDGSNPNKNGRRYYVVRP